MKHLLYPSRPERSAKKRKELPSGLADSCGLESGQPWELFGKRMYDYAYHFQSYRIGGGAFSISDYLR